MAFIRPHWTISEDDVLAAELIEKLRADYQEGVNALTAQHGGPTATHGDSLTGNLLNLPKGVIMTRPPAGDRTRQDLPPVWSAGGPLEPAHWLDSELSTAVAAGFLTKTPAMEARLTPPGVIEDGLGLMVGVGYKGAVLYTEMAAPAVYWWQDARDKWRLHFGTKANTATDMTTNVDYFAFAWYSSLNTANAYSRPPELGGGGVAKILDQSQYALDSEWVSDDPNRFLALSDPWVSWYRGGHRLDDGTHEDLLLPMETALLHWTGAAYTILAATPGVLSVSKLATGRILLTLKNATPLEHLSNPSAGGTGKTAVFAYPQAPISDLAFSFHDLRAGNSNDDLNVQVQTCKTNGTAIDLDVLVHICGKRGY